MSEPIVPEQPVNPDAEPVVAERAYLSPAPIDPKTGRPDHTQLKPHQAALRQAVVDAFNAKKARKFLQKHVHHISTNRALAEGISIAPGPLFSARQGFQHFIRRNSGHPWNPRLQRAIVTLGVLARKML